MKQMKLDVDERKLTGRKVKKLREEGVLPANIFGRGIKSLSIELPVADFSKAYQEAGNTNIIYLNVNKKEHPVLVSNVQIHPVTSEILHVDFHEINLREKVTATVQIELEGEAPAEKQGVGNLVQLLSELEVEALPMDLPKILIADVTKLTEIDQAVTVKNLKYDKTKVEIKAEPDEMVAKIEEPQKEEIVEPVVADEGEAAVADEQSEGESPTEEATDTSNENK